MKLREKIKRFWTLDVHNHEGFTLVELIIVIAILAILSSVAVVGYSSYVEKANKQADMTLAAEIEQALLLAMYSDMLTSGDYVVIKYNGEAVAKNSGDENILTAAAAMEAAFGAGWEEKLQLNWDGWSVGVAGDAEKMGLVYNSNFAPANMDKLLGQLQDVVGDASQYLGGGNIKVSAEIAALLQQNGFDIKAGDTLDPSTSMAAANAYVFLVAGELGGYDVQLPDGGELSDANAEFLACWIECDFSGASSMDSVSAAAAEYAAILALAKYIDANAGAGTTYENQLNISADPRDDADAVLTAIQNSDVNGVQTAYNAYYTDPENGIAPYYNDAMAFLTYMQGVSDSSDNLLQNTNLSNGQYFVDGYVFDYVNSYLAVSDVLAGADFEGSAMAFFFVGDDIVCMFSEDSN